MAVDLQQSMEFADWASLKQSCRLTLLEHSEGSRCPLQVKFGLDLTNDAMAQFTKFQPDRETFGGKASARSALFKPELAASKQQHSLTFLRDPYIFGSEFWLRFARG